MFDNIYGTLSMPIETPYAKLQNHTEFVTGEIRAGNIPLADPVSLNYKLMIHFESNHGLFADANIDENSPNLNTRNSAVAYLYRIGEIRRAKMLQIWIANVKELIKYYDFLFLLIEGLESIMNFKPEHVFGDDEKVNFIVRETSDLFVQSIITNYRNIVYDDVRKVEILPINLRRFDAKILVFSAGYFNLLYFDDVQGKFNNNTTNPEDNPQGTPHHLLTMPTKSKLKELDDRILNIAGFDSSKLRFNNVLFSMEDCSFNIEDSGKGFTANIWNEQNSEFIRNNITFNFKRASHSGTFSNISGNVNIGDLLAKLSIYDAANKYIENSEPFPEEEELDATFNQTVNNTLDSMKVAGLDVWRDTKSKIKNRYTLEFFKNKILGNTTFLGETIEKFSVDYAKQLIKNTIDYGLGELEDLLINDPLSQINNFVSLNFGDNIYTLIKNNSGNSNNGIELIENQNVNDLPINQTGYTQPENNTDERIRLGGGNVYTGQYW